MNFSKFEYLLGKNDYMSDCIKNCIDAERLVRTRPAETAANARRAVEQLFKHLSKANKIKPENLARSIEENCKYIEKNSETIRQLADEIRRAGNDAVHYNIKRGKSIDAANKENIARAMTIVNDLFDLLCEFHERPGVFDESLVPFNGYSIVRKLSIPEELNRENYFICTTGQYPRYYYLQCLSLAEELESESRREEASERIYNDHKPDSRLCIPDIELELPKNSDRKLVVYKVYKDSFLLSELKKTMTTKQALKVGLDLTGALEDLKYLGMYHRNIFPGCILINTNREGGYEAYLLNLQTSKVLGSNVTISHLLAAAWDRNCYIPASLQGNTQPLSSIDWEKLDVYALCRVVLFCMDKELALTTTTSKFAEYPHVQISGRLRRLYGNLFREDSYLDDFPTLEELKEILQNEYNLCD